MDAAIHTVDEKFAESEQLYKTILEAKPNGLDAAGELKVAFLLAKAMVANSPRPEETAKMLKDVLERHRRTLGNSDPDVKRAADMHVGQLGWFVWVTCMDPNKDKAEYAKAIEYAQQVIDLSEKNAPIPLWALAYAQLRHGDVNASQETMQRAIAVEPVEPGEFMWLVMAMIEKANGNDDTARALHFVAARWMAKIRSTWDVGANMRQQTGEATGMSPDYPPQGWTNEDCLAAVNRLVAKYPRFPRLLSSRAAMLASDKRWEEAIADYRRAAELNPDEFRHLEELTALTLYTSHDAATRTAACQRFIEKFLNSENPYQVADLVVVCSLAPDAPLEWSKILEKMQAACQKKEAQENLPFMHMAQAMALYRCGKYQETLDIMPEVNWQEGSFNQIYVPLYRAMAYQQLGDSENSKRLLEKGRAVIDTQLPSPQGGLSEWRDRSTDWCMAQLARQEAEALIEK